MKVLDPGPYMNEDGDWWVPVEGHSLKDARALVIGCLDYFIPEGGRLQYEGKEEAWLGGEGSDDPDSVHVLAFHFVEKRPW